MTISTPKWTRPTLAGSLLARATADQAAVVAASRPVRLPNGGSLNVLDCGSGEAVVLMPMIVDLNFVYAPQIAEFQTDYRVLLYEPRLSPDQRVAIRDRADELRLLLNGLNVTRAHIVVWGDTGAAAYHLAKHHPQLCRSLVFIGLADRYKFPQPYGVLLKILDHLPIEGLVPSRLFAALLGRFVGGTQIKPEWIVERAAHIPRLTALFKHSILPNLTEHRPKSGEVTVPSLVIAGDNDRIVSVAQAQRMAALLPCAGPAVIVPGGQHFVNYIDDVMVNQSIRRFFATVN